ncbi:hypothetical protein LCGC14_2731870 [marine sediment metagenome]|uniref:Uncharacterized protein n=1 Tax=marine sediment metagenome TaxID=412755 RepID=A0A0F8ZUA5_9ZZZZ
MSGPRIPLMTRRRKRHKGMTQAEFEASVDKSMGKFPTFKHKQKNLTKEEMEKRRKAAFKKNR